MYDLACLNEISLFTLIFDILVAQPSKTMLGFEASGFKSVYRGFEV